MAVCSKGCKPLPRHLSPANGCTGSRTMGGAMARVGDVGPGHRSERIEAKGRPRSERFNSAKVTLNHSKLNLCNKNSYNNSNSCYLATPLSLGVAFNPLLPLPSAHTQLPLIGWGLGAGKAFNCLWLSCFPFSCSLILFLFLARAGMSNLRHEGASKWKQIDTQFWKKEWTQQGRSHHTRKN